MKKSLFVLAILFAVSHLPVLAGAPAGKDIAIKGLLVDANCYVKGGFTTDDHDGMIRCGRDCLKEGLPAGILVDKKLYLLLFPGKVFADYVGKTLEVSGTLYEGSILLPAKADIVEKTGKKSIKLKGKVMM
jgi:hypothetical protein